MFLLRNKNGGGYFGKESWNTSKDKAIEFATREDALSEVAKIKETLRLAPVDLDFEVEET